MAYSGNTALPLRDLLFPEGHTRPNPDSRGADAIWRVWGVLPNIWAVQRAMEAAVQRSQRTQELEMRKFKWERKDLQTRRVSYSPNSGDGDKTKNRGTYFLVYREVEERIYWVPHLCFLRLLLSSWGRVRKLRKQSYSRESMDREINHMYRRNTPESCQNWVNPHWTCIQNVHSRKINLGQQKCALTEHLFKMYTPGKITWVRSASKKGMLPLKRI